MCVGVCGLSGGGEYRVYMQVMDHSDCVGDGGVGRVDGETGGTAFLCCCGVSGDSLVGPEVSFQ